MSDQSKILFQQSLLDIPNAISLPALEPGATPSETLDGQMTEKSGQAPALANLSARQAKEKGLLMSGTYGQRGSTLSSSVDLMLSLASRLRARTDALGSTLFKLTWKQVAMPSGRSVCVLRVSGRRTSGSDCSSWPTPHAGASAGIGTEGREGGLNLQSAASLAHWPTPMMPNGGRRPKDGQMTPTGQTPEGKKRQVDLNFVANLVGWATPRSTEAGHSTGNPERAFDGKSRLEDQVFLLAAWQSPTATAIGRTDEAAKEKRRQYRESIGRQSLAPGNLEEQAILYSPQMDSGQMPNGSTAETKSTGQLNPAFSLWLMGLPIEWLSCAESAMELLRQSRKNSSKPTSKAKRNPLITKILSQFADKGEVILDPFAGSGTTGRAAKDLGLRSILIEEKKKYCDIAPEFDFENKVEQ